MSSIGFLMIQLDALADKTCTKRVDNGGIKLDATSRELLIKSHQLGYCMQFLGDVLDDLGPNAVKAFQTKLIYRQKTGL